MEQQAHLTEEQFAAYRKRTLAPLELLGIDDHIAVCGSCRERLCQLEQSGPKVRALHADMAQHLEYEQVVACLEAPPFGEVASHLAICELCRDEVEDLRRFRREMNETRRAPIEMPVRSATPSRRWHMPAIAAAGLIIVAGLSYFAFYRGDSAGRIGNVAQTTPPQPGPPATAAVPSPSTEAPLSVEQNQAVQLALASHKLERAPILDRLISKPGVLLGGQPEPQGFDLTSPAGSAVLTDRPTFHWKAATGASRYVVSVFDDNFQQVAESPALQTTEWQPVRPLPAGKVLIWQVTATLAGGETVRAPVPPAAEARFEVAPRTAVDEIESARHEHPANHLLMAVLDAKAGALDDASQELDQLAATDPQDAEALRANLRQMRGR